jgi:uncharacterized protein (UPF0210 family)
VARLAEFETENRSGELKMWNPFAAMNPSGVGQQTLVGQVIASGRTVVGATRGTRRRRKASRKTAARKRAASPAKRATRRGSKPARLVKGSAAAKAYMAKIRRKRKR